MATEELVLTALTPELLAEAASLCGECVGENLYTEAQLAEAVGKRDEQFYLLMTPEGSAAAYIYFRLIGLTEAERLARYPLGVESPIFRREVVIGNLQSIGVRREYRNHRLAERLVDTFLSWLIRESDADMAFGVFWKPEGRVPMEPVLKRFGFCYLTDSKKVWYDKKDLICPVCRGRCCCDAAIYYKLLERKEM